MKVLLIGASSDIAKSVLNLGHSSVEFIQFTSHPTEPNQQLLDVQDETTFPQVEGEINGLVYFPGSINLRPFSNLKLSDFQSDYDINVLGLIKILKHYHKQLAQDSSVVLLSSVAATVGMPFHASITMCKSAIEGLTRALAAEWSPKVRVNCVAPSVVQTKLSVRLFRTDSQVEQMNARHPMQRVGQPHDIAQAIDFLLSDKSAWMTGQVLHVDGGLSTIKK